MSNTINFGHFNTSGDQAIATKGLSSNLNTMEIVDSLVKAKEIPITRIKDEISKNTDTMAALSQFNSLLSAFQTTANVLRNPPTFDNASIDVFEARIASINSNTSIPGNTYLGLTASGGAAVGNYAISDIVLATAENQTVQGFSTNTSSVVSSSSAAGMFTAGTFQINGTSITLSTGDSLTTIAANINAVSKQTNVSASIIELSSSNFQLVLQANQTGAANAYTITDSGNIFDSNMNVTWTRTGAANSSLTINNNIITRSTNSITDLVPNVTFNLYQASPHGTTLSVGVDANLQQVTNAVTSFIGAYNDLLTFYTKQTQRDDTTGKYTEGAMLGNDLTVRGIMDSLKAQLILPVTGLANDDTYNTLSTVGINFTNSPGDQDNPPVANLLTFANMQGMPDFNTALSTNLDWVRQVFEMSSTSNNTSFKVASRTNQMSVNSFAVDLNTSRQTSYTSQYFTDAVSAVVAASPTSNMFTAGVFQINGQNITISAGQSLNDIIGTINSFSGTTKVTATLTTNTDGVQLNLMPSHKALDPTSSLVTGDAFVVTDSSNIFTKDTNVTWTNENTINDIARITYNDPTSGTPTTINATYIANTSGHGGKFVGQSGTVINGLNVLYNGNGADVGTITFSQGVADKIYNVITSAVKVDGEVNQEILSIKGENQNKTTEISSKEGELKTYRQSLLQKFAGVEDAIANINHILQLLDANDSARRIASS